VLSIDGSDGQKNCFEIDRNLGVSKVFRLFASLEFCFDPPKAAVEEQVLCAPRTRVVLYRSVPLLLLLRVEAPEFIKVT
jgi:hypothetical protein